MAFDSNIQYQLHKARVGKNVDEVVSILEHLCQNNDFILICKKFPVEQICLNIQNEVGLFCKEYPKNEKLVTMCTRIYRNADVQSDQWQAYVKIFPQQYKEILLAKHIESGYRLDKWINFASFDLFNLKPSDYKKILKRDPYLYIRSFMQMNDEEYGAYNKDDGWGRVEWINKRLISHFPDFHTDTFAKWWGQQPADNKARVYMLCATMGNPKHFKKLARLDEGIPCLKTITNAMAILDSKMDPATFRDLLVTSKTESVELPSFEF